MSDTKIEWATKVWNPVTGCTPISEGCANCYAVRMAKRLAGRYGYPADDPFKAGTLHEDKLQEPYHWKQPQKVFVCSMGDLFHDDVPFRVVRNVLFPMFGNGRRHTYMILTKRPERMLQCLYDNAPDYWPLPNVWLGVTAENQRTADERIPILLNIPAAKRFVSVEPMLGPINLIPYMGGHSYKCACGFHETERELIERGGGQLMCGKCGEICKMGNTLNWVIVGPETGPRARHCDRNWINNVWEQCKVAGVPFFDKRNELNRGCQEWPA